MKFAYKFSNLLGTIYRKGNVIFSNDGNSIITPVGNRITIYDLKNNKSNTLSLESRYNYTALAISPNGCLLIAVNEQGQAQMISLISNTVIYTHKFKNQANIIQFSPDGKYFAVGHGSAMSVYLVPGEVSGDYGSFTAIRHFSYAHDDITWIDWSHNSKVLAFGARDNMTRIHSIEYYDNFRPFLLSGHTDGIVGCFFEENSLDINTVSRNGQLCLWECSINFSDFKPFQPTKKSIEYVKNEDEAADEFDMQNALEKPGEEEESDVKNEENEVEFGTDSNRDSQGKLIHESQVRKHPFYYNRLARHYLIDEVRKDNRDALLTSAHYHKKSKLLITGYSTGAFYLHEMPDVNLIHSLSITEFPIQTVCFNNTGDWVALGSTNLGQLLVWEWQSEQYVMKQQGHANEMNCIAYSPDGQYIVSGGEDAKVKVWNVSNGFCFVTFSEHTSAVTAIEFSANKKFVVSASLDGTVRAYDLIRYRNFRTFTSPRPVQFRSLAIDHSGELVAAGGQDVFEVYLWSMKLGRLLEVLSGHEAPVVSLAFAPIATSSMLVSGSWDNSIKIWNCLESSGDHETIETLSDVTAIAFRPNGQEIAVATLNGIISFFNVNNANQIGSIEGRNDLGSGRGDNDLTTAEKNKETKYFSTLVYSSDGETILAAGKSKNVCIYNVKEGIILKKFEVTQNHSLDGLDDYINRRNLSEFGNMALIEERDALEGGNVALRLPGVQKGDMASRNFKPEVNVFSIKFSPTGLSWAAATTEGLLVYALDRGVVFDPLNLSIEVTPKAARNCIEEEEFSTALIMSLKLNEAKLIEEIIEKIPHTEIELVVRSLPDIYAERTLEFISRQINSSKHIEFYLKWSTHLLTVHAAKENAFKQQTLLSNQDAITRKYEVLSKICDYNKYTLKVLLDIADDIKVNENKNSDEEMESEDDEDFILLRQRTNGDQSDKEMSVTDDSD